MANNYIRDFIKITLNNIEFIIQSDSFDSKGCINSCVQIQIEFCLAPKVMFFSSGHVLPLFRSFPKHPVLLRVQSKVHPMGYRVWQKAAPASSEADDSPPAS